MKKRNVDCVVIGGGPGGYPAAIRLAQGGKQVVIIEAGDIGGTCLHRGCIPTKAYLATAEAYRVMKDASAWGLSAQNVAFNWPEIRKRKDEVVKKLCNDLTGVLRSYGIDIVKGYGSLIGPSTVSVTLDGQVSEEIQAKDVIIAAGSEVKELSIAPFDGTHVFSSTTLLDIDHVPESLLVVGGGVIGCEFASIFAEFGSKVHVVEALDRILPLESENVSKALTKAFQARGIEVSTSVSLQSIKKEKGGVTASLASGKDIKVACALIAVGRSLNSSKIGLDKAGIRVEKGAIQVDDTMKTNVPHVWAVGDVVGKTMYAHAATHQGIVAADNILGHVARMRYDAIPGVIFTHPEVGTVGMTLAQAKAKGIDAVVGAYPMQALGKALAAREGQGSAEIVVEKKTGRILGAQIVGSSAETLIAELTMAIENELTIECISETIHAHPTLSEIWPEAALMVQGKPLHFPKKA